MKTLEIEAEIEFTAGEERRREADPLLRAFKQNEKLRSALYEASVEITELREQVDKLCAPPPTYGVYLSAHADGAVDVLAQGRKVKVTLHPTIEAASLRPGQKLVLNEALNVVAVAGYEIQDDVVVLKERLDERLAVVLLGADAEKIGIIADPLRSTCLKPGDHLLMDPKSGYLLERLPKTDVEDLALEEVPDIGYRDVGGLAAQITAWRGLWTPAAVLRQNSARWAGR
jgi:proteasome-associated ATPase